MCSGRGGRRRRRRRRRTKVSIFSRGDCRMNRKEDIQNVQLRARCFQWQQKVTGRGSVTKLYTQSCLILSRALIYPREHLEPNPRSYSIHVHAHVHRRIYDAKLYLCTILGILYIHTRFKSKQTVDTFKRFAIHVLVFRFVFSSTK